MQTFLPYPNFARSAKCLDNRRLNKQRVECKQILNALQRDSGGWINHPAVRMWREYEQSLIDYALAVCDECDKRGIRDNVNIRNWFERQRRYFYVDTFDRDPHWLGNRAFHRSHQSNLRRKDPEQYPFNVPANLPYVWPVAAYTAPTKPRIGAHKRRYRLARAT